MSMYELKCQKCGGELQQKGDFFECGYCHSSYASDNVQKEREMMEELFDEQKQEQIASLRHMLWEEIHSEYIDSEKIIELCISLQKIKPDDFEARFFEVANSGNGRQLSAFLDAIDVSRPEENFWVEEVVKFMIKSLRAENLLSLNDLIERAYKNTDLEKYEKYATHVSDEAKKVEGGIYEPELPRDVFVMYSSKDFEKVKELVYTLEESGLKCFVAMRNLQHGRGAVANYQKALETAMDNCKIVVFLSSKNSRSLMCDAVKVEIPYLRKKDIMNAPYEYRMNYEQMPLKYKKPRVEYRLDNEGRGGGDFLVKEFFGALEYTYSAEEVLTRVIKYLTQGVEDPAQAKPQEKYCLACGAKNPLKTKFCMECGGREFAETKEEYESKKRDKDREALEKAEKEKQELLARLQRMEEAQKEADKRRAEEEAKRKAEEAERKNKELMEKLQAMEAEKKRLEEQAAQKEREAAEAKKAADEPLKNLGGDYSVQLTAIGPNKISVIKAVREFVPMGLADAKRLVESAPTMVATKLDKAFAEALFSELKKQGATAEIVGGASPAAKTASTEADVGGEYSVKLTNIGPNKIGVIKVVRENTGLGLYDAKNLVERAPVVVKAGVSRERAEMIVNELKKQSATAEIVGGASPAVKTASTEAVADEKNPTYAVHLINRGETVEKRIEVIKTVRKIVGLGLYDAKQLCERAPVDVRMGLTKEEAEEYAEMLRAAGGTAEARLEKTVGLNKSQRTERGKDFFFQRDYKKAAALLEEAAKDGDVDAQRMMGYCYRQESFGIDHKKSFEWFEKAGLAGDADAQYWVGMQYALGEGVSTNNKKAVEWLEKAAAQGHKGSYQTLGDHYADGKGVTKDYDKAMEYYEKVAPTSTFAQASINKLKERIAKEEAKANANAATATSTATATPVAPKTSTTTATPVAPKTSATSSSSSNSEAERLFQTGYEYYKKGDSANRKLAFPYLEKAAALGHVEATHLIGYYYFYNEGGVGYDKKKAVEYFRKAAEKGWANAEFWLGHCYSYGDGGLPEDSGKARDLYIRAAKHGNEAAQKEVPNWQTVAMPAFPAAPTATKPAAPTMSADQLNKEGIRLDKERKYSEARGYFEKAAALGHVESTHMLGYYTFQGLGGITKNQTKAVEYFQKAANKGWPDAEYWLGNCYHHGYGIAQDFTKAFDWYKKAAGHGNEAAKRELLNANSAAAMQTQDIRDKVAQRERAEQELRATRIQNGLCRHCGGTFKGLFTKVCSSCGQKKDY